MAMSWSAFHANSIESQKLHADLSALLPLFEEDFKSPAMIRHALDVIKEAVVYSNGKQIACSCF